MAGDTTNKVSRLSIFAIQKNGMETFRCQNIDVIERLFEVVYRKNRFRSLLVYKVIKNGTNHLLNVTFGSGC